MHEPIFDVYMSTATQTSSTIHASVDQLADLVPTPSSFRPTDTDLISKVEAAFKIPCAEQANPSCKITLNSSPDTVHCVRLTEITADGVIHLVGGNTVSLAEVHSLCRLVTVAEGRVAYPPVFQRGLDLPITDPWREAALLKGQLVEVTFLSRDERDHVHNHQTTRGVFTSSASGEDNCVLEFQKESDGRTFKFKESDHILVSIQRLAKPCQWENHSHLELSDVFPVGAPISITRNSPPGSAQPAVIEGTVAGYSGGGAEPEAIFIRAKAPANTEYAVHLDEVRSAQSLSSQSEKFTELNVIYSR